MDFMKALKTVVEMAGRYGSIAYESDDPDKWGDEPEAMEAREAFLAIKRLSVIKVDAFSRDHTGLPDGWRTKDMKKDDWLYTELLESDDQQDENEVAYNRFTDFERKWCCDHGLTEEITEQRALCELSAAFECRRRNALEES